jgi:glyoxylase I family protein
MKFGHYGREDTGYGVLLVDQRSGSALELHTNTGNDGDPLMRPAADWTMSDELGIEHSGIRDGDEPFPFATLVFRDPDNIQLELFAVC